jgi:hypothetical protein
MYIFLNGYMCIKQAVLWLFLDKYHANLFLLNISTKYDINWGIKWYNISWYFCVFN